MRKRFTLLLLTEASLLPLLSSMEVVRRNPPSELLYVCFSAHGEQAPTCSNLLATNSPLQPEWDFE